jgi:hypothetical protein
MDDTTQKQRHLEFVSRVACSDLAWHLLWLTGETDCRIALNMTPGARHPTEDRLITEQEAFDVTINPHGLNAWKRRLNARSGDLPKQFAAVLRDAAAELEEIANQVEGYPGYVPTMIPNAFVARDHETGELIGVRFQLAELLEMFKAYEDVRNARPSLECAPITDFPELVEQWKALAKDAGIEVPNG